MAGKSLLFKEFTNLFRGNIKSKIRGRKLKYKFFTRNRSFVTYLVFTIQNSSQSPGC